MRFVASRTISLQRKSKATFTEREIEKGDFSAMEVFLTLFSNFCEAGLFVDSKRVKAHCEKFPYIDQRETVMVLGFALLMDLPQGGLFVVGEKVKPPSHSGNA